MKATATSPQLRLQLSCAAGTTLLTDPIIAAKARLAALICAALSEKGSLTFILSRRCCGRGDPAFVRKRSEPGCPLLRHPSTGPSVGWRPQPNGVRDVRHNALCHSEEHLLRRGISRSTFAATVVAGDSSSAKPPRNDSRAREKSAHQATISRHSLGGGGALRGDSFTLNDQSFS